MCLCCLIFFYFFNCQAKKHSLQSTTCYPCKHLSLRSQSARSTAACKEEVTVGYQPHGSWLYILPGLFTSPISLPLIIPGRFEHPQRKKEKKRKKGKEIKHRKKKQISRKIKSWKQKINLRRNKLPSPKKINSAIPSLFGEGVRRTDEEREVAGEACACGQFIHSAHSFVICSASFHPNP